MPFRVFVLSGAGFTNLAAHRGERCCLFQAAESLWNQTMTGYCFAGCPAAPLHWGAFSRMKVRWLKGQ